MPLRHLLNIGYAWLAEGRDAQQIEALDRQLAEPFDHELTPEERRRAEALRMVEARGGTQVQDTLLASMRQHGLAVVRR